MNYFVKVKSAHLVEASIASPVQIECRDGRYEERVLYAISPVENGYFLAYQKKDFLNDGSFRIDAQTYSVKRLLSYRLVNSELHKREFTLRFDENGQMFVVDESNHPVGPNLFPDGISIEILDKE